MKYLKTTFLLSVIFILSLSFVSCKEGKKENSDTPAQMQMQADGHEHQTQGNMNATHSQNKMNAETASVAKDVRGNTGAIISDYLTLKNALTDDDNKTAAKSGKALYKALKAFDISGFSAEEQKELKEIIDDAAEHAEHISDSPIDHQREHFVILSQDLIDLIGITGTDKKLYIDFCPMADNNKGANWLSEFKEIKNPFFGSSMPTCGEVKKEI